MKIQSLLTFAVKTFASITKCLTIEALNLIFSVGNLRLNGTDYDILMMKPSNVMKLREVDIDLRLEMA